jgi:PA14 domain.
MSGSSVGGVGAQVSTLAPSETTLNGRSQNIVQKVWQNGSGNSFDRPTFNTDPDSVYQLSGFDGGGHGEYYQSEIEAFLIPPKDGDYTFWLTTDNKGELHLSSDELPSNSNLIASLSNYAGPNEWTKYSGQQSSPVTLEGGKPYYIRGIYSEGSGGDHIRVGWDKPGDTVGSEPTEIIPPENLIPFRTATGVDSFGTTDTTTIGSVSSSVGIPKLSSEYATTTSVSAAAGANLDTIEGSSLIEVVGVPTTSSMGMETATATTSTSAGTVAGASAQSLSISPEAAAGAVTISDGMVAFPTRASNSQAATGSGGTIASADTTVFGSGTSEAKPGVANPTVGSSVITPDVTAKLLSGQTVNCSTNTKQASVTAVGKNGALESIEEVTQDASAYTTSDVLSISQVASGTPSDGAVISTSVDQPAPVNAASTTVEASPQADSIGGEKASVQTNEVPVRTEITVGCTNPQAAVTSRQATGVATGAGGSVVSSSSSQTSDDSTTDSVSVSPPTATAATSGVGDGQAFATDGGSVVASTTPAPSSGASASIGGGVTATVSPTTPGSVNATATSLESETVATTSGFGADAMTASVSVSATDSMLSTPSVSTPETATTANAEPSSMVSLGKFIDPLTAANPEVEPQTVNTFVISSTVFSEAVGGSTTTPSLNGVESPAFTKVSARGFTSAITWTLKAPATSASLSAGETQLIESETYQGIGTARSFGGLPLKLLSSVLEGEGPLIRTPGVLPYVQTDVDMNAEEYAATIEEQKTDSIISDTRLTIFIDDVTTDFEPL